MLKKFQDVLGNQEGLNVDAVSNAVEDIKSMWKTGKKQSKSEAVKPEIKKQNRVDTAILRDRIAEKIAKMNNN